MTSRGASRGSGGRTASEFSIDLAKMYAIKLSGPEPGIAEKAVFWLLNSDFHVVACYRYGQFADRLRERNRFVGTLAVASHRLWNRWTTHVDHADIHHLSSIGPGLLVMHRHGVMVNATIGDNCVIHQNVTIGQHIAGGDQSVPRIGNNVWIGPGAIITGPITIGDGATISAGTVLSKDVPAGCLVAGNPGRVIAQNYDNAAMLNFAMPEAAPSA
ncbi:MAG: DapH/DapD/GlmU-related protein [Propionicimonas sp.]|nr:DapH/DapD/GlmU-related protein [Propionicimonas sp.]